MNRRQRSEIPSGSASSANGLPPPPSVRCRETWVWQPLPAESAQGFDMNVAR